ncbi:MAG: transposase, partial [Nitrososphaerota archaeon]|nr:transposase [Nitrososphaerota archaeon]
MPQVNLVMLTSAKQHLPVMIRVVPGSVRDVSTIKTTLAELGLSNVTLILDRGIFSDENIQTIARSQFGVVVAARRNSKLYEQMPGEFLEHFFYRSRLIKCGRVRIEGGLFLYFFCDFGLCEEEETTLYRLLDEKRLELDEFGVRLRLAGKILVVSNLDVGCRVVFELYMCRGEVERQFDTFKNTLQGDLLYLHDDFGVFGHLFVGFLSFYGYCVLQNLLRREGLLDSVSVFDLLEEFSLVYGVDGGGGVVVCEVPK